MNDHAEPSCSVSSSDHNCLDCAPSAASAEFITSENSADYTSDGDDENGNLLSHIYTSYFGGSAHGAAADFKVVVSNSADGVVANNLGGKVFVSKAAPAITKFEKPNSADL